MLDDCVLKLGNYPIIKAAFFIYLLFWWFVPTFAPHTALVRGTEMRCLVITCVLTPLL